MPCNCGKRKVIVTSREADMQRRAAELAKVSESHNNGEVRAGAGTMEDRLRQMRLARAARRSRLR